MLLFFNKTGVDGTGVHAFLRCRLRNAGPLLLEAGAGAWVTCGLRGPRFCVSSPGRALLQAWGSARLSDASLEQVGSEGCHEVWDPQCL